MGLAEPKNQWDQQERGQKESMEVGEKNSMRFFKKQTKQTAQIAESM